MGSECGSADFKTGLVTIMTSLITLREIPLDALAFAAAIVVDNYSIVFRNHALDAIPIK